MAPRKSKKVVPGNYVTISNGKKKKARVPSKPLQEWQPEYLEELTSIHKKRLTPTGPIGIAVAVDIENRRVPNGIILRRMIKLVEATNSPYNDFDLRRFEIAVRRSVSVRVALTIRDFFAFGRPSKLVIELPDSETIGMKPEEITVRINEITTEQKDLLMKLQKRDELVNLKSAISKLFFQQIIFARGILIKGYPLQGVGSLAEPSDLREGSITKLVSINSRRLGLLINDPDDYNEFEGLYVDGQPLDRLSMIYMPHQSVNISPYTQNYGYTPMETVVDLASSSVSFDSEDTPEILKSAWMASILLKINTDDLSDAADKQARIDEIVGAIDPGLFLGVDKDVEAEKLDYEVNFEGLTKFADRTDLKIFKALGIPQSLVQAEDTANKSTADSSASLFLDGVVSSDQDSMSDILWQQYYEPYVRELLGVEKDPENPSDNPPHIRFRVMRRWDKATAEQFEQLVNGTVQLVNSGIWDIQKANEKLQTEEVTQRVTKEDMENKTPFNDQEGQPGNLQDRMSKQAVATAAEKPAGQWITTDTNVRIFIPEGADANKVISEQLSKVKTLPQKKAKGPVKTQAKPFGKVREDYQKVIAESKEDAFSYNPKTGKVTDAFDKEDASRFFDNHSVNGQPVYVISKTNNQRGLNRRTESSYNQIINEGNTPLIGRWKSDVTGVEYTDMSFPVSGISESEAKGLLRNNAQESALVISSNGLVNFLVA